MLNIPERISRQTAHWPMLAACIALLAFLARPAFADKQAHFTEQQVRQGKQVFNANCSECHGSRLQGGAGPALKGTKFASSLNYGNYNASGLYDFISSHMPKTNPGGLSEKQYIEVFSYILSQNGFPTGSMALDKNSLSEIKLLPLPGGSKG